MPWEIEYTDEFESWWQTLSARQQAAITTRVSQLEQRGPNLGRPEVDHVRSSRHQNMKELRASADNPMLRVLFAFDPRRSAILLLGGDKSGQWNEWYRTAVPAADRLFDEHLAALEQEGL